MAYVIAAPELMTAAATDLATIASNVNAAHLVAAAPTVAVVPAAADEVSAGIAHLFSQHAANYQALAGQAAAFNDQFVLTLKSGGAAYAQTEATSAAALTPADVNLADLLSPLLSLLPPGIQSEVPNIDLNNLAAGLFFFTFIAAPVIAFLALAFLLLEGPYFLMHPQQLLQLLMTLGL